MKYMSRLFSGLMLLTIVLSSAMGVALAQPYPNKPINFILSFPPGGGADIVARIIVPPIAERLGQPIVIHNRGGGNTTIGTGIAAKAPPDGYNLFLGQTNNMVIVPALFNQAGERLPYDAVRDFETIAFIGDSFSVLVVKNDLPVKSVKELIALAKSKPGKLNYCSSGKGGIPHLSMEMLKNMAGVDIVHVPYKGAADQLTAVMSGEVEMGFVTPLSAMPLVKAGKLKALAVSSAKRSPTTPDLPTIAEEGLPGFEAVPWYAVVSPTGTPKTIVAKLNMEISKALKDPKLIDQLAKQGVDVKLATPEQFNQYVKAESVKWNKLIKDTGLKMD
jgi:tripartite-type tricarboxylate transporter receptor subunit TctC